MDKPHQQVVTTNPVAIKEGQLRIHVRNEHPWHRKSETVKCPSCPTSFVVTANFPTEQFFAALARDHADKREHPDYIASEPAFTHVEECGCDL